MLYLAHVKHTAQSLGDFNGSSTHQYRATSIAQFLYLSNNGFIFLAFRFVNAVVHIVTGNRTVGRNYHHIQLIDVPELTCFCLCRTCHTSQLVVHTEVVLQGDGGKGLRGSFYLHTLLRLNSLVQTIAPTTTFHDTTCLLVHNLYLVVDQHVVHILSEHGVGLEQLQQRVYALRLDGIVGQHIVFLLQAFLIRQVLTLEFR